jgi:LacI family transcriptional regulator
METKVRKRPTMNVVAEAAGVSVATVDRVLNSRLPVRDATAHRVIEAAQSVGYHATELMKMRVRQQAPLRKLGICLQKSQDPFYQALKNAFQEAAGNLQDVRCQLSVEFMDELSSSSIAEHMMALGRQVDVLAVVAVDHPHINDAVEALRLLGKPTFTLLSDISAPKRGGYVGLDNRKVGRAAAWTIARSVKQAGKVGLFVGSHRYLGQETREISFRSYFREHATSLQLLDTLVNLEDPQLAYEATLDLLHQHPDLVALYVAGGGSSGVIRALREEKTAERITVVCNEWTPDRRAALIEGVVDMLICTPEQELATKTLAVMVAALEQGGPLSLAQQHIVDLRLAIAETI